MAIKYDAKYIYNTYNDKVKDRIQDIELWVSEGKLFGQIAKELGVSNSLLWAMRTQSNYTELRNALKVKNGCIENAEYALYRKAVGYFVEVEKPMIVKKTYFNKEGKKGTQEEVRVVKYKQYIEPDTQAIKFLLINKLGDFYHAESQKPVDNTLDTMLGKASEVLIKVKETADEENSDED